MNSKIIDLTLCIDGFKHLEELISVINRGTSYLVDKKEKQQVFNGFELILRELQDDITLQRNTLLQTMFNVKQQYAVRNRHRHTARQMNAITLAIAHVRYCLRVKQIKQEVELVM